jgi:ketosteroid isomerase-like protein
MVEIRSAADGVVRRTIERLTLAAQDAPCGELLTVDVRWHEPGRSLVAGDYEGCDEVRSSLFGRLRELSGGTFRVTEWDGATIHDGREIAMYVVRARRAGRDLLSRDVCVAELRGGAIAAARVYHADQHAWDRFWS